MWSSRRACEAIALIKNLYHKFNSFNPGISITIPSFYFYIFLLKYFISIIFILFGSFFFLAYEVLVPDLVPESPYLTIKLKSFSELIGRLIFLMDPSLRSLL